MLKKNTKKDKKKQTIKKTQSEGILEMKNLSKQKQELQMQASSTEYKIWMRK